MNRNENALFSMVDTDINFRRSTFKRPFTNKMTFNAAYLIPFYKDEVLPGDTFSVDMSAVIRMTTPIFPVIDNRFIDVYFFYVPNRLVWSHWVNFMGENTDTAWIPQTTYSTPKIDTSTGFPVGSIADYLGIPTERAIGTGTGAKKISAIPFRRVAKIYNDWFRDENRKQPAHIYMDETTRTYANTLETGAATDYVGRVELGGMPPKAAKFHDYFTSTLPGPLKYGEDIKLPIGLVGTSASNSNVIGMMPVYAMGTKVPEAASAFGTKYVNGITTRMENGTDYGHYVYNYSSPGPSGSTNTGELVINDADTSKTFTAANQNNITFTNLWADARGYTYTSMATIRSLRQRFAVQQFYEKMRRRGSRYTEVIREMFGVTSPDARLQRSEYLGGIRVPVNISAVVQVSSTDSTSPQGNVAANSMTTINKHMFTHSFTEHGHVIGLMCVRHDNTYQQGIDRSWMRSTITDYYWPTFANLSESPVYNREIYYQNNSTDEQVFGYQEAWAEYRYKPSYVSGKMRSTVQANLDAWHYADYYTQLPIGTSTSWIDADASAISRTLAVPGEDQFIADIQVVNTSTRPMPVRSIPGLTRL